jgi:hypothetical protein
MLTLLLQRSLADIMNPESERKMTRLRKLNPIWRTVVETSFIVFLFYSNLLMGQFTASGMGQRNGLLWAIREIFTISNFIIALVTALVGHLVFEFFRRRV